MAGSTNWRYACVTRAQTIASGMRMIDLAMDGPLPRMAPRSITDFAVAICGVPAIRAFDCIPAPNGRIRVTVGSVEDDGLRFMWSLVEGAVVRMTVPKTRFERDRAAPPGFSRHGTLSPIAFAILAVNDAIILGEGSGAAPNRPIVANSSIV
ncbi:MAG: hypothetical protein WDZ83_16860 [Rhizobiaceae bacterium]